MSNLADPLAAKRKRFVGLITGVHAALCALVVFGVIKISAGNFSRGKTALGILVAAHLLILLVFQASWLIKRTRPAA